MYAVGTSNNENANLATVKTAWKYIQDGGTIEFANLAHSNKATVHHFCGFLTFTIDFHNTHENDTTHMILILNEDNFRMIWNMIKEWTM